MSAEGWKQFIRIKNYKIIIDFAHTPDGLMKVLETLNKVPHNRIITLIGHSGGNRDSSMRPDLGRIALENSDEVIFTADNQGMSRWNI